MGWLAAIGSALKAAAIALGWMKQSSDQADGAKMQRGADDAVALKDASDVQKADAATSADGVDAIRQQLLDDARP